MAQMHGSTAACDGLTWGSGGDEFGLGLKTTHPIPTLGTDGYILLVLEDETEALHGLIRSGGREWRGKADNRDLNNAADRILSAEVKICLS